MSQDEDFTWLKSLHAELRRPGDQRSPMEKLADEVLGRTYEFLTPREKLTYDEVDRINVLIVEHRLITELYSCGMICGVGMAIYGHPEQPGMDQLEKLLCIEDRNLPPGPTPATWQQRLMTDPEPKVFPQKLPGSVDPYAWDLFSGFANRPDNLRWLKEYNLQPVKHKHSYDY